MVYDSLWVEIKAQDSTHLYKFPYNTKTSEIKLENVLSSAPLARNPIKLFFGKNTYGLNDTLYFLSKNKNATIDILDSSNKKSVSSSKFSLRNVYQFDPLFAKFLIVLEYPNWSDSANGESIKIHNILNFISKNIDNPYTFDLYTQLVLPNLLIDYETSKSFFTKYIDRLTNSPKIYADMERMLNAKAFYSKENIEVPEFSVRTLSNEVLSSNSLKGKYTLINFWATWCVPCREEFPILKSVIQQYQDKGLTAISVSLDKDTSAMHRYISANHMNWAQVANDKKILSLFGINPIPQVYLINPKGIIVYNKLLKPEVDKDLKILAAYLEENINDN